MKTQHEILLLEYKPEEIAKMSEEEKSQIERDIRDEIATGEIEAFIERGYPKPRFTPRLKPLKITELYDIIDLDLERRWSESKSPTWTALDRPIYLCDIPQHYRDRIWSLRDAEIKSPYYEFRDASREEQLRGIFPRIVIKDHVLNAYKDSRDNSMRFTSNMIISSRLARIAVRPHEIGIVESDGALERVVIVAWGANGYVVYPAMRIGATDLGPTGYYKPNIALESRTLPTSEVFRKVK